MKFSECFLTHAHTHTHTHTQSDSGDVDSARLFSQNYLVEMSAVASSGQDAISGEMKNFAEHLKPYPL